MLYALTNVFVDFIGQGLLAATRGAVVVTFGDLPHVCVHRNSLRLVQ